jgi:uncharacterized protein YukE
MTETSNIDSDKIMAIASQLDALVERMNGQVMKFADAIERLDKGWVSEIKAQFMSNYQKDLEAMQEMISQLFEVTSILRESATEFDRTENEIASSVASIR